MLARIKGEQKVWKKCSWGAFSATAIFLAKKEQCHEMDPFFKLQLAP
jgi:hypothetical protein